MSETPKVGGGFKITDNESQNKTAMRNEKVFRDSIEYCTKREKAENPLVNKGFTAFANKKVTS